MDSDLTTPIGLSVDWISRRIYWTNDDLLNDTIEVADYDGSHRSVVVSGDLHRPMDVVVHPIAK